MGRALLIILLSSILVFGIISIQISRVSAEATKSSTGQYRDYYAKNIANSMIDIIKNKLRDSTNYRVNNIVSGNLLGGTVTYRVVDTVLSSNNLVKVQVTASYEGSKSHVEAYFNIKNISSNNVPPFMQNAITSGSNVNLSGNVTVKHIGNTQNANIHANGNFNMTGNNQIYGFVKYTGTATSSPPNALNTRITPISNPENLPVHSQTSPIQIPTITPENYLSIASDIYYGNASFSGNLTLGTKENPKIIFVTGNLNLSGNISGYGIFIVMGTTNISGNVTISTPDENFNNVGIFSGGNINLSGNVTVNAQMFSNSTVNISGNVRLIGSLTSRGVVSVSGSTEILYKPTNSALTRPIFGGNNQSSLVEVNMIHFYE